MANYGMCRDCANCDLNECNGYKVHCDWYGTYEDPDELRDCNHYEEINEKSACFNNRPISHFLTKHMSCFVDSGISYRPYQWNTQL